MKIILPTIAAAALLSGLAAADQPTVQEATAALANYKGWGEQDGALPVIDKVDQCVPTFGQPKTSWTCLLIADAKDGKAMSFTDMPFRRNAKGAWEFDDADPESQGACPVGADALPVLRKHKKADDLTVIIEAGTGGFVAYNDQPGPPYYFQCEYAVETKGQKSFVTTYVTHYGEAFVFSDNFEDNEWPYPNNEWPDDDGKSPSQKK